MRKHQAAKRTGNKDKPHQPDPTEWDSDYVRISLSIPKTLYKFFQREAAKPQHAGNRSSYVRTLIVREMTRVMARAK